MDCTTIYAHIHMFMPHVLHHIRTRLKGQLYRFRLGIKGFLLRGFSCVPHNSESYSQCSQLVPQKACRIVVKS